ncbi:MAG: hypothetical protein H6730_07415 [Deltaproteobacteria bacterium]|nr:hypothetical protein [Deltaproteobacteria bacterium]
MSRLPPLVALAALLAGCPDADFSYPTPPPEILRFSATPFQVAPGAPVTLRWETAGADRVALGGLPEGEVVVDAEGQRVLHPDAALVLTLSAVGPGGERRARVEVQIEATSEVAITLLEVTPAAVRAGMPVRVRWATDGARAVSLRTTDGGAASDVAASGAVVLRPTRDVEVVLRAEGAPAAVEARRAIHVLPERAEILSFNATPNPAVAGAAVTVVAEVQGFTTARIWRDTSDGPLTIIEVQRADLVGEDPVELRDVMRDLPVGTTTLHLTLETADTVEEDEVRISVTPAELPRVESFTVTPTVTGSGGDVRARWRAQDVSQVDLLVDGRAYRDLPLSGEADVVITRDQDVQLRCQVAGQGALLALAPVQVDPRLPTIVGLTPLGTTDTSSLALHWEVLDADRVELSDGAGFSATSTHAQAALTWTATRTVDVRFRAVNAAGATERHLTLAAGPLPEIVRFETPRPEARSGRWVRFEWETVGAQRVWLLAFRESRRVPASGALYVRADTTGASTPTLIATGLDGSTSAGLPFTVGSNGSTSESEPNDHFQQAQGPFTVRPADLAAWLTPDDVDYFYLPGTNARLQARLTSTQPCPAGLLVEVWRDLGAEGPVGPLWVVEGSDGVCPRLDSASAPELADLEPPWFLVVRRDPSATTSLPYVLQVSDEARACGDGVLDVNEACDDGNTQGGDGCDRACLLEGTDEVEPNDVPGLAQPWSGAPLEGTLFARDIDLYTFTVAPGAALRGLSLSAPGGGACGLEAELRIFDAQGSLRAHAAAALCPSLPPEAVVLEPGTYQLQITPGSGRLGPRRGGYLLSWDP